jgi:hypothetical protein
MIRATVDQVPADAPSPFVGALVTLDRPRKCCVCANPIHAGEQALAAQSYVSHTWCGIWSGFSKPPKGAK